ncbi:hypothetical protein F2Q70_00021114 [Brassica cretica]|uniref:Uncharacterized protein n=1 Tax=Brassica cretica TaxID=69181 RepID=A0A8S9HCH0_BRACR|nr:hypothetical protein F2Q70_00021114 [Brassica cretica]KAF2555753.1 hypothetical protein F2Q68_00014607 [Brassica cretica]
MTFLGIRQKVVGSSDEIQTNFFFPTKRYRRTGTLEKEKGESGLGLQRIGSESVRRWWSEGRVGQDRRIRFAAQTQWKTLETWLGENNV